MISKFKIAPLDGMSRVLTAGTFLLVGFLTLGPLFRGETEAFSGLIFGLVWMPLILAGLFAPLGYGVSPEGIIVHRLIGRIVVPGSEIRSIEVVERVKPGIRLFASGGLFGWFGLFTIRDEGTATVYATRWDRMVRVETTSHQVYYLSPKDPDAFVEAARKY